MDDREAFLPMSKPLDCVGIDPDRIVHGAGQPPIAEGELAAVTRERDALKAALEDIEARSPMTLLSQPPMDFAAERARESLAKLASGDLRKPK